MADTLIAIKTKDLPRDGDQLHILHQEQYAAFLKKAELNMAAKKTDELYDDEPKDDAG